MLLETFKSEKEALRLTTNIYYAEQEELVHKINAYLLDTFFLKLSKEYEMMLREKISYFILASHMHVLKEHASNIDGQITLTAEYPLIVYLRKNIQKIFSDHVHFRITQARCIPTCYLIALYIQNISIKTPLLNIGITARTDLYSTDIMKANLIKYADKKLYRSIDDCEYDEVLSNMEKARKKYDVVLCDERLSNDALFLSYQEINYNFEHINYYLRMLRNICWNVIEDKNIHVKNLLILNETNIQKEIYKNTQLYLLEKTSSKELINHYVIEDNCIVMIMPQKNIKHNYLQFGEFTENVNFDNEKLAKYILFAGNINQNNIRIINLMLHEMTMNISFWKSCLKKPSIITINNHLNKLLY